MRIVHVTYQHSADDARILHKQCRSISKAGHDTHLIAPQPKPNEMFGVRFHSLSKRDAATKFQQIRRWFKEIIEYISSIEPDIVHLHDPLLLSIGKRLRSCTTAKIVYDAHEDHPRQVRALTHLPWLRKQAQAALFGRLEHKAPQWVDLIIAATHGVAKRYPEQKTIIVRNLPRIFQFTPAKSSSNHSSLIYVGGLTKSRGVFEMIDAMAELQSDDAKLILAGRFDSKETQHAVQARPGWDRVDFRGWVQHSDIPELLQSATVGMVVLHPKPNYIDAWPVKLFEYMAAGLPFIASDFSPWKTIVQRATCGIFVDPLNVIELAKAMTALLDEHETTKAMGVAGRSLIENELNWESEATSLLNGYDKLFARS